MRALRWLSLGIASGKIRVDTYFIYRYPQAKNTCPLSARHPERAEIMPETAIRGYPVLTGTPVYLQMVAG